ncbi:putative zinc finger c2h2 lyar-type protein [Erysiphe necator]|uniref:Putative zinc finger c2h2 lyar-type protein n=1 Tax=Uncinula necator TaxID=52586 RepID=A0A0B1P6M1_UNCNE|nr:putative zinc finger c2h2 lyar-type protein [Erysiphe necator]
MVSFSCEACGDVLLKKKLDAHRRQCVNASYTCLDCMTNFENNDYRAHTSCISEQQKYEGALYRPGKNKSERSNDSIKISTIPNSKKTMHIGSTSKSASAMNVFDFLDIDQTSLLSDPEHLKGGLKYLDKGQTKSPHIFREISGNKAKINDHQASAVIKSPKLDQKIEQYRDKTDCGDILNGTKRKRLHLEPRSPALCDQNKIKENANAVILHTQLTGDLTRLMRHPSSFPLSPEFPGENSHGPAKISPTPSAQPTKTKGTKKRKETFSIGSGVKAFITAKPLPTKLPERHPSKSTKPQPLLLEDHPKMKRRTIKEATSEKDNESLVVYQPRSKQAQLLFGLIDKGLESPRGVSMSKALKKFHRERELLGLGAGKVTNEKELLKNLRVRRNERGELVLFV